MINRQDAQAIASGILGHPPTDSDQPWELEEFDHGWLILEAPPPGETGRGGTFLVIERATGQVLRFPSSVPPDRIIEEYPEVRERGQPEQIGE